MSEKKKDTMKKHFPAFTLVELVIVIAVLGILAGVSVIGYGKWRESIAKKEVQSDLQMAVTAMENTKNFGGGYPTDGKIPSSFKSSPDVDVLYGSGDAHSYCIQAASSIMPSIVYFVNSTDQKAPVQGTCAGGPGGPIPENGGVVTTLAGSTSGYVDATGTAAQFNQPYGVAVDASGDVYVADMANGRIRKITPSGVVTTLTGSFNNPTGVAVDVAGNIYVAEMNAQRIRKISSEGTVTILAGSGSLGYGDGTGTVAKFRQPYDVAVDRAGAVYVADTYNHCIRKITPSGVVTTLAGSGAAGFVDGAGVSAQFNSPRGVAVDTAGNVYVADTNNYRIRKITSSGIVTTLAGSGAYGYAADGTGATAQFGLPYGVAADRAGNVYVTDQYNIRKITPSGVVTTLAGSGTEGGSADGVGTVARFSAPSSVAVDGSGVIYVADRLNYRIRKIE